ncbi:Putative_papain-like cysteine peptidase (DUF1796) [Hexamita inflata]|uniref:Papain-like cysteine peptidase (DUF1796) n=1 Tax=Hexamita inflata TaxID=28002 RepID=A0AA86TJS7_9EUKA|nr:Putative papain-like cysteine peptidase (DUF1796) [Hexamita inflata]
MNILVMYSLQIEENIEYKYTEQLACIMVLTEDFSYIQTAIDAFFNQTYQNIELWLVYDTSFKIMNEYLFHYYPNILSNSDYSQNLNRGKRIVTLDSLQLGEHNLTSIQKVILSYSKVNYFCNWNSFIFQASNRLETQLAFMQSNNVSKSILSSVNVYDHSTEIFYISSDQNDISETIMVHSSAIGQDNINISIVDQPIIYVSYNNKQQQNNSIYKDQQLKQIVKLNKEYDGIISLGSWCQVGGALTSRRLHYVQSPFSMFGFRTWQEVINVLQNDFSEYWEYKNMRIGKQTIAYSYQHMDTRLMQKIYDEKYNIYNSHHFEDLNEESYKPFHNRVLKITDIFKKQMEQYERVLFVVKLMSTPFYKTVVYRQDIIDLNNILLKIRGGKSFNVRITVQEYQLQDVEFWLQQMKYDHFEVGVWKHEWNTDVFDEEWEWMLDSVRLAPNHVNRLLQEIIKVDLDNEKDHVAVTQVIDQINGWGYL